MALHQATRQKVYDALVPDGPLPRSALDTLDRRTARNVLRELSADGWLQVLPHGGWQVGPAVGHVVIVDISWRRIRVALCDANETILKECMRSISLRPRHGPPDSVRTIRERTQALIAEVRGTAAETPIVGATVVWPGPVPRDPHAVVRAGFARRAWRRSDLRSLFSRALEEGLQQPGIPVSFVNDANAAALGEAHYGAARGCRNLLLLKICEGIGASLIVDGHIYAGASGKAGEVGHVVASLDEPVDNAAERSSLKCSCGASDHLESYASTIAIIGALFPDDDRSSYEECVNEITVRRDDYDVRQILRRSGEIIGRTLCPLVQMLDPDRLLIDAEPDAPPLFDNLVYSLKRGAQIDGERFDRATHVGADTPMSQRGATLLAIREYLVPRLRHGILGESSPNRR